MSGPETISSFFHSRQDWIDVGVVKRGDVRYLKPTPADGYDIVIRVDGAYLEEERAELIAEFLRGRLANLGLLPDRPVHLEDLT